MTLTVTPVTPQNASADTLQIGAESGCDTGSSCAKDFVDTAVSQGSRDMPCVSHSGNGPEISSSSSKFGHGGARANSGGPRENAGGFRENSGGPRVNSGGPRPNSGGYRPNAGRKPTRAIQALPTGPRWYVFQTFAGSEDRVSRDLARGEDRPGWEQRPEFKTFLPQTKTVRVRRGHRVVEIVAMIESYGFVRFDAERDPWRSIRSCDRLVELFTTRSGRPLPVSDQDVDRLMKLSEKELGIDPLALPAMPKREKGSRLRVTNGPFTSFDAICIDCDGITTKADLWIFGRHTAVELSWFSFEDVAEDDHGKG